MPDESSVAAGKRFSRDMRLIREDRELTIDDIHKETRIARTLLESFEEGGLYEQSTFNEVYLRSFVQAYAEAVGISTQAALDGLEAALDGVYENSLADQFIGRPLEEDLDSSFSASSETEAPEPSSSEGTEVESDQSSSPRTAGGPEGRGGIVGPPRAMGEEPEKKDMPESDEEAEGRTAKEPTSGDDMSSEEETSSIQESTTSSRSSSATTEQPHSAETSPSDSKTSPEPEDGSHESESDADSASDSDSIRTDAPSWMEEGSEREGESASTPAGADEAASAPSFSEEEEGTPPVGASGETGIVGEPTAMGSEEAPAEAARPGPSTAAPTTGSRRRSRWLRLFQGEQREIVWAGIGFIVTLLVLVGLGVAYFSSSSPSKQTRQTGKAADTTASSSPQEDTTMTPDRPPPANITLGDTIYLTVLATSPVSGIRIQRDEDLQRPYWIEEGEAEVYPFQQRVTIENELEDIRLFLSGYPFPIKQQNTTGQLVVNRSQVQAFVDTLRGTPTSLSVSPDTIPKGPPPTQ